MDDDKLVNQLNYKKWWRQGSHQFPLPFRFWDTNILLYHQRFIQFDQPSLDPWGQRYCWWLKFCTSWYVVYLIKFKGLYVSQVVQDFFHQQYHLLSHRFQTRSNKNTHHSSLLVLWPKHVGYDMSPPIHHDDCLEFRFLRKPKTWPCFFFQSDLVTLRKRRSAQGSILSHAIRRIPFTGTEGLKPWDVGNGLFLKNSPLCDTVDGRNPANHLGCQKHCK